jgi:HSP20 family molecular chaperone IbpA
MSSPARSPRAASDSQIAKPEVLSAGEGRKFLDAFNDLVSRRAYELFDRDGQLDGNDVAHWLQAEHELTASLPDVREAANSFTANVRLPEVAVGGVKVYATEDRVIVYAEIAAPQGNSDNFYESSRSAYWMVRWPEIVDPNSCRAELDDDNLTISARKAEIQPEAESKTGTESSEGL